jgi:hypothetical protein
MELATNVVADEGCKGCSNKAEYVEKFRISLDIILEGDGDDTEQLQAVVDLAKLVKEHGFKISSIRPNRW